MLKIKSSHHLYYKLLCLLPSLIIFRIGKVVFWHCGTKPKVFLSQIWQYPLTNNFSQLRENLVMTHQISSVDIRSIYKGSLKGWHLHCNALAFSTMQAWGMRTINRPHIYRANDCHVALGLFFINKHTLFWTNVKETDAVHLNNESCG